MAYSAYSSGERMGEVVEHPVKEQPDPHVFTQRTYCDITTSSEASLISLKPEANSNLGLEKYRKSGPRATLRSTRDHEYPGLISISDPMKPNIETANTGFTQPQSQN